MKKIILFFSMLVVVLTSFSQIKIIKDGDILLFKVGNKMNVHFGSMENAINDIQFVLGGPFVGRNGKPIGAIVQDGDVTKSTSHRRLNKQNPFIYYNSIFGVNLNGNITMVRFEEAYADLPEMQWAFQNGPALVINGTVLDLRTTQIPNISTKDFFSGIGYTQNGEIIILVTLRKMTVKQFSFVFQNKGCVNALLINSGSGVFYSINNSLYRKSRARKNFGKSTNRYNFLFYN